MKFSKCNLFDLNEFCLELFLAVSQYTSFICGCVNLASSILFFFYSSLSITEKASGFFFSSIPHLSRQPTPA